MKRFGAFLVAFFVFLLGCGSVTEKEDESLRKSSYVELYPQKKSPSVSSMKGKCRKGDYRSCYKYGLRFYLGKKVKKDYKKAGRFFYKACQGEYMRACYALGIMYKNGKGTEKNCENADKYFETACDGGHQKACNKMWSCKKDPRKEDNYDEYDDYGDSDDYDDDEGYVDEDDWDESDDGWDDF